MGRTIKTGKIAGIRYKVGGHIWFLNTFGQQFTVQIVRFHEGEDGKLTMFVRYGDGTGPHGHESIWDDDRVVRSRYHPPTV